MKTLRTAAHVASLCVLSAALALARNAPAQSLAHWHEARGNTARTGVATLNFSMQNPRVAWRIARSTPGLASDSLAPSLVEIDLDGAGAAEVVALTDRSIAAWDGTTGQRLWPRDNGEFFPLLRISGVGDLDGDGRVDIVAEGRDNTVAVYDASGSRRWALAGNRVSTGFTGTVRVVNFSGAGGPPQLLVVRTDSSDLLRASLFSFDRTFAATEVRTASISGDAQQSSTRTAVGDFNGDALLDLMILRTVGSSTTMSAAYIEGNDTIAGPTWTVNTRSLSPAMTAGSCVPPSGVAIRTQVFASGARDVVAFKQSAASPDGTACIGAVDFDGTNPRLRWSAAIPGPDSTTFPFVGNIVDGGNQEMVAAYAQTIMATGEVQNSVRVIDAITGTMIETFGSNPTFTSGYLLMGLARLDGASGVLSVLTSNTSSARYVHRHNGAGFQRSSALNNLVIDRLPRLLVGSERYGISSGGRNEPIIVETATGSAVLGRSSANNARLFTITRDDTVVGPAPITGAFVAPRINNRGALLTILSGTPSQYSLRRVDGDARVEGADVRDPVGPPLFLRVGPSFTSTTALRAELRAMPTGLTRGHTVLSPNRPSWIDLADANPFEVVPAAVPSALGCNETGASVNTLTTSAEFIYMSSTAPMMSANRHFFDRTMGRCQVSPIDTSSFVSSATTGLSFTGDFIRTALAGPPPSGVLGFMQRDVTGGMRELYAGLWPVSPPQSDVVAYRPGSGITTSLPVTGSLLGRSFTMVVSTVGSSSLPPHVANFFLGETPLRLVRATTPDLPTLKFAPQSPIVVDGSAGSALIINNNPGHFSSAYMRPSILRAEMVADSVNVSFAAWAPATTVMDNQAGVVVRCGANYRFVFRVRASSLDSDDPRVEAWEFNGNITAPPSPDYTMGQGMIRVWSACLDRAGGSIDCAMPAPTARFGRATYTNLAAAQNATNPVVFLANSAGQITALENVCATAPSVRWTFNEPRALASTSVFDADGDGQAELVALSSDGTYHGIDEAECARSGDPRCPASRPFCDVAQGACVECLDDAACVATGRGRCDLERRACAPCAMATASCAVSGGTCTSVTRAGNPGLVCSCSGPTDCNPGFACVISGDAGARGVCTLGCELGAPRCPLGQFCQRREGSSLGVCEGACTSDDQCARTAPSRPVCAPAAEAGARACVECTESAQCAARSPPTPVCAEQRCVECTPGAVNACEGNARGNRCMATASCGCDNDVDCNGSRCDRSTHSCAASGDAGANGSWTEPSCACDARSPTRTKGAALALTLAALVAGVTLRRGARHRSRATAAASMLALTTTLCAAAAQAQSAVASAAPRRAVQCGEDASAELFAEAREQFDAGQTALLANDAPGAERALRAAIALFDSPNTHLLLGRALAAQQRVEEAYDEFETTVLLATRCSIRDATERGRARYTRSIEQGAAERAQLASRVALLGVHFDNGAPSGASITIGTRPSVALINDRTVAATPGASVSVVVTAPGYQEWRGTVSLERGRVASIEVTMQRIVEGPRVIERRVQAAMVRVTRISPVFYAGISTAGAGLAATAAGATIFLLGRERYAALDRACTASECPREPAFLAAVDRGQSMEFAGQITMYTGVGVTAVGAVLTIATLPRTEWVPAPSGAASTQRARLHVTPTWGGLSVGGAL